MKPKYPFVIQIYITKEMREAVKETAKRTNMSRNEWVRRAIQAQLEKDKWV